MQDFNIVGLLYEKREMVEFFPLSRKAKDWCESISMKVAFVFIWKRKKPFLKWNNLKKLVTFLRRSNNE